MAEIDIVNIGYRNKTVSFLSGMILTFTVWTAIHSSTWTVDTFIDSEEKAEKCRNAMKLASVITLITAFITYAIFKNMYATAGIVIWTVILYWIYEQKVREAGY